MRIPYQHLAILAALAPAILAGCGSAPDTERTPPATLPVSFGHKDAVLDQIEKHYFAPPRIDTALTEQEIVNNLDPFSAYFTRDQYDRFQHRMNDEVFRFGFGYHASGGHVIITSVTAGSAAEDAGLIPGDEIESISRMLVYGSESRLAQILDRATKTVEFGIRRVTEVEKLSRKPIRIWMERTECPEPSIPLAVMLDTETGYIEMVGFHEGTAAKLRQAIDNLAKHGMKSLVLDVRGNGGGLLDEALAASNLFVRTDSTALEQHSRIRAENRKYTMMERPAYPTLPLVLLVDAGSASATEIFAGIMQDLSRATIIGQPTCGKGLVMRFFDVPNGDKLYLAISEYYLPSGRCVQRPFSGPKMLVPWRDVESQENFDHALDSQLAESDCSGYPLATGKAVYGSEGIVPDVIVREWDYPKWLSDAVYQAEASYLHQNTDWLLQGRLDNFDTRWSPPESLVEAVLAISRANDTSIGKEITARIAWEVPTFIKWYLAYGIWGDKGTFAVRTRHTAIIRRALDVLHREADTKRTALLSLH